MANPNSLPCYEKTSRKNTLERALDLIILVLLLSLLAYRLISLNNHGFTWLLAFLCESWFTFIWVLTVNAKWSLVDYKTYPDHLLQRVPEAELPPVDMFVTTADPVLEPPIIVVNTVLSLLAVDYPANKLACYVSDDGCSPLTFYSLVQALEFAKLWVPFCRKYSIGTRAPFRYFSGSEPGDNASPGFRQEMEKMMEEYNQLSHKIQVAVQKSASCDLTGDYAVFSDIERSNHSSIIKVIWDNKEGLEDGLPHLVYISREKRPKHPHHYKAGAMNVLTRVSGVMTNAPFMLNVDCDMYANNPHIVLHAMCLFFGAKQERDCGFVQSPQIFYDGLKDDPFGNQMVVLVNTIGLGLVGIQGPLYGGTGCFHRRKIIYGSSPDNVQNERKSFEGLEEQFGNSVELTKSAAQALSGLKGETASLRELPSSLRAAHEVAGCGYEYGTSWGEKVGWSYGSTTEDILTGIKIHARGWKSMFCTPDPPAFLGCAPSGGPATMTQMKRWATGLLEILFSSNCPFIATFTGKLQFRQCLAYSWILLWGLRSIPELCYAILPAFCIISNSSFLPKIQEPAIVIPVSLFVIYNLYTIYEYFKFGLSIRAWWNNQRMVRITSASAWFFGVLSVLLKLLGISETVFEITQKDQESSGDGTDSGRFTFDESIAFVPGTTLVLVHLTALVTDLLAFRQPSYGGKDGAGMGEFFCSVWVLLMFSPFMKGLFGKGKYGIPFSILCKSGALALLFVSLCINGLRH